MGVVPFQGKAESPGKAFWPLSPLSLALRLYLTSMSLDHLALGSGGHTCTNSHDDNPSPSLPSQWETENSGTSTLTESKCYKVVLVSSPILTH